MDYLDPRKKRHHAIILFIGYGLITIAIAIATVILVYVGSGYYVDRSTGDLIQNGQLFVNSDPDGATISLNGKQQKTKTAGRLVVPSGSYDVKVSRSGYRDWSQTVQLDGGRIQSIDYIRLVPKTLTSDIMQTFTNTPSSVSQSVNRRFVTMIFADKPNTIFVIDTTRPDRAPTEVALAKTVLANPDKPASLKILEWSDDDKHFLLENIIDTGAKEYIVASRDPSDAPVNLTTTLNLPGVQLSLRDRSTGSFYAYNPADKSLSVINQNSKQSEKKLSNVLAYKTFDTDTVLYITAAGATQGKVQARLLTGDKNYLMRELTEAPTYLLDMAKLGNTPVMAIGSPAENKVTILRNPIAYLRVNPLQAVPLATTVLQVDQPTEVSFSTDATTVVARGAQNAASHHFEEDRTVKFAVAQPLVASTELRWIDGKHFTYTSDSKGYVADYDGSNVQQIVPSVSPFGLYFDNDYQAVFSFTTGAGGKPFNVTRASMRVK